MDQFKSIVPGRDPGGEITRRVAVWYDGESSGKVIRQPGAQCAEHLSSGILGIHHHPIDLVECLDHQLFLLLLDARPEGGPVVERPWIPKVDDDAGAGGGTEGRNDPGEEKGTHGDHDDVRRFLDGKGAQFPAEGTGRGTDLPLKSGRCPFDRSGLVDPVDLSLAADIRQKTFIAGGQAGSEVFRTPGEHRGLPPQVRQVSGE